MKAGVAAIAVAAAAMLWAEDARAQMPNLQGMCSEVAQALTYGGPHVAQIFGPGSFQLVMYQTGGSGAYAGLQQMGPVHSTILAGGTPLPQGVVFSCRTNHAGGYTDWLLGYGYLSNRIEYLTFYMYPSGGPPATYPPGQPAPVPSPYPGPPTPAPSPQPSSGPAPPPGTTEACQRFPDLC